MSNQQHVFARFGGTRFVATMASGAASVFLLATGHLSGDQYVQLGMWTISVYIAGNAGQNIAGLMSGKNNNTPGGGNDTH